MGICGSKAKGVESASQEVYSASNNGTDHHYTNPAPPKPPPPHPTAQQHPSQQPVSKIPSSSPGPRIDTILGKSYDDVKLYYTLGKELDRGQFGVTYLCTDKRSSQQYACKSISNKKLVTKADKEDMRREIQIMQHLSGQPNIVEFKGAYEDKVSVNLVMELCAGGELFDRIIAKGHYSAFVTKLLI